jgi:hypothetical protein
MRRRRFLLLLSLPSIPPSSRLSPANNHLALLHAHRAAMEASLVWMGFPDPAAWSGHARSPLPLEAMRPSLDPPAAWRGGLMGFRRMQGALRRQAPGERKRNPAALVNSMGTREPGGWQVW